MWTTDIIVLLVLSFLLGIALVYAIIEKQFQVKYSHRVAKLEEEYTARRKKSNDIARNTLRGQLLEQFVPHKAADLENLNPFDFRFTGDFCDYIVIDGYTNVKDGVEEEVKRIIFLEVKSGEAKPSKHQQAVIDAINAGRIEHKIIQVPGRVEEW